MWLKILWQIIVALVTGKLFKGKTDEQLNAERAEELGRLKAERDAYQANCRAEADAIAARRETERRMSEVQERPPKPKREPKDGMKVFTLTLLLTCPLLMMVGCAVHQPIAPAPTNICPTIPLPTKPQLPDITIHQQGNLFCFTEEEMTAILQGIDDLKGYSDTLEETIKVYNETCKP